MSLRQRTTHPQTSSSNRYEPAETEDTDQDYDTDGSPHVPVPAEVARVPMTSHEKWKTFRVRTTWTLVLIFAFFLFIAAGHPYCALLVLMLSSGVYREVIALKIVPEKDKRTPVFMFLRWYWFTVTLWATVHQFHLAFFDGLTHTFPWLHAFRPMIELLEIHHGLITYAAGVFGLIVFIASLRRADLKYQFSQFAFMLLACLLVGGQALFQFGNIFSGLIWFFTGTSSVIVNDIFAYIFGVTFGRTKLTRLSPNKTLEGFLGSSVVTLLWALVVASLMAHYKVFICPEPEIDFTPFRMWSVTDCQAHSTFQWREFSFSLQLIPFLPSSQWTFTFQAMPVQVHALFMGFFAAFFAPFGGLFASAFKRAIKIKDFGETIPGHGGITDRFDCQILMGMFTALYLKSFVFRSPVGVTSVEAILMSIRRLSETDQMRLVAELTKILPTSFQHAL